MAKLLDGVFPVWGPYGKKYMGISRVADEDMLTGVRFDFTASPAVFASGARVPNTTYPCGCRAWKCDEDYSYFSYRFDLEGKDDVYAIVSYIKLNGEATLVRTEFFNNSEIVQNFIVNYFSSIEYRFDSFCRLRLPEKCLFVKATDYSEYEYAIKRPWDEQNCDAMEKGTFLDSRFTLGKGLGDRAPKWHMPHKFLAPFGGERGDKVSYSLNSSHKFKDPVLTVRYRTSGIRYEQGKMVGVNYTDGKEAAVFALNGRDIRFEPSSELKTVKFDLDETPERIELVSKGGGGIEFDFFAVTEREDADRISAEMNPCPVKPEIRIEKEENGFKASLKYENIDGEYILRTFEENTRFRNIDTGCLEDCLPSRISNADESFDDLTESFTASFRDKKSDSGFFHNAVVHTLFARPGSSLVTYAVISRGETDYLEKDGYEKIFIQREKEYKAFTLNEGGKKYELSNELLKAAVLTNVVYPIYRHGRFIIHNTPGKRWDCLYTWDSGFIGLGTLDYAPKISRFILDTYLSCEENKNFAFVHHGSPVPVQFYAFLEMMNRDSSVAGEFYDRLKLYYDFFTGKIRGSTTNKFKSGLLTTYDYFYSSSGMDDYPAQVSMMNDNLRDCAAPVITTAQAVRIAKIMKNAAAYLKKDKDIAEYDSDIERLTEALNRFSWDSESGYYSYVLHDENREPTGKYVLESGENLNRGLDGIYPIVAGVCSDEQKNKILRHLKSDKEMLSPYGISAVDMSASYFRVNGYWNGHVWFSHQWFIFKAMLDIGENDFAFEIAKRALDIWKRETEYAYYTFEMVNVVTGRGGWFHNFGGLSTPINMWASYYFKPGTVTAGFDTLIEKAVFSPDKSEAEISVSKSSSGESIVLVCLKDGADYQVESGNGEFEYVSRFKGELEIKLPKEIGKFNFNVKKA